MDRKKFYKRQPVTQAEVNGALEEAEASVWALPSDLSIFGIASGAVPTLGAAPTVNVTSGVAYDQTGKRIKLYFDGSGTKNHSYATATDGGDTSVTAGQERWITICARAGRKLSDARVDGDGATVYHVQDEAPVGTGTSTTGTVDTLYIIAGVSAGTGTATRPALPSDAIVICDIKRTPSDASNVLDTTRRQMQPLQRIAADQAPDAGTPAILMKDLVSWLGGRANTAQGTLKVQLDKIINDLAAQTASDDGAERIGTQAAGNLLAGSVRSQLDELDAEKAGLALANTFTAANVFQAVLTAQAKITGTLHASSVTTPAIEVTGTGPAGEFALISEWPCGNCKFRVYRISGTVNASDGENLMGNSTGIMLTMNAQWNGSEWQTDGNVNSNSSFLLFPFSGAVGGSTTAPGIVLGYRDSAHDAANWANTYGVVTGWTKLHRIGWYHSSSANQGGARAGAGTLRLDTGIWKGISGSGDVSAMSSADRKKYYLGGRGYNVAGNKVGGRETLQPSYVATPTQGTLTSESTANAAAIVIDTLDTNKLEWSYTVSATGAAYAFSTLEIL